MNNLEQWWRNLADGIQGTTEYKVESISLDIAVQVYQRMKALGLNQTQLAEKLHVSKSYISQILKGKHNLTLESLVKVAEALEMKAEITLKPIPDKIDNAIAPEILENDEFKIDLLPTYNDSGNLDLAVQPRKVKSHRISSRSHVPA
jgi:transcriptional regulator with XRE-family HTH domain